VRFALPFRCLHCSRRLVALGLRLISEVGGAAVSGVHCGTPMAVTELSSGLGKLYRAVIA
jgi:hypothetical protein